MQSGERVLARFLTDLDASLHFHEGLIVLTDTRLMHVEPAKTEDLSFHAWNLSEIEDLVVEELGPIAELHLMQGGTQSWVWRVTAGRIREADSFLAKFKEEQRVLRNEARTVSEPVNVVRDEEEEDEDAPTTPRGNPLWRLIRFSRPWYRLMALGFFLAAASTAAGLIAPWLTGHIVDEILIPLQSATERKHVKHVYQFAAKLGGVAMLAWILKWATTYVVSRLAERVTSHMRRSTFEHLQTLSLSYFNKKRTGDLISRIGSDTDHISLFISINFIDFLVDALTIVFTGVIMFTVNPLLAAAALGPLPVVGWLVQKVRGHLRGGFAAATRAWSAMNSVLSDTIPGVRVVKAFAQEQREIDRFRQHDKHIFDVNDRVNRTWSFFEPTINLLSDLGLLVVWAVGAWSVAHDRATVGMIVTFVAYVTKFYGRLDSMSRFMASSQRAAASAHRIFEILDVEPDMPITEGKLQVGRLRGAIDFRDVKFRSGNRMIIKGVSLKIAPGEMIGLVGPSGAGKTTLVNLACRFFDVSDGAVVVDGMDVRDVNVMDYRRNLGLVLQEPYLFYGTIAENISYGKPAATRGEIIAAARAARAHDFIMKQPDGYDSLVGERGGQLSGGERQRISIARALLIDPALLILDEATSAVDTETEREIQAALDNLVKGRTTIAIAHRLGTLRKANRLIVMEDGKITETGSHDELMQRSGTYSRLHKAMLEVTQPV